MNSLDRQFRRASVSELNHEGHEGSQRRPEHTTFVILRALGGSTVFRPSSKSSKTDLTARLLSGTIYSRPQMFLADRRA